MSERLEKALAFANYRQTLNNQLHKIKVRSVGALLINKHGGEFLINKELISFLDYLVRAGFSEATILDDKEIPVHIPDTDNFLKEITTRYFEITNDYFVEFQSIKKSRNVKSILDIKDEE